MAVEAAGCQHTGIGPKMEETRAQITQEAKSTILTVSTMRKAGHAKDKKTRNYPRLHNRAMLEAWMQLRRSSKKDHCPSHWLLEANAGNGTSQVCLMRQLRKT